MMKKRPTSGVLTALTIGISAMIALQTPVTAYANDNENAGNGNEPENEENLESGAQSAPASEQTENIQNAVETVGTTIESAIGEAADAIESVSDPAPAEGEAPIIDNDMSDTANAAANLILNGDPAASDPVEAAGTDDGQPEGSAAVDAAVDALIDAAKLVDTPSTDASGNEVTSVNQDLGSAKDNLEGAKADLEAAAGYSAEVDTQYSAIVNNVDDAIENFNTAVDYVDNLTSTVDKAKALLDIIEAEDTSDDDFNAAVQELRTLLEYNEAASGTNTETEGSESGSGTGESSGEASNTQSGATSGEATGTEGSSSSGAAQDTFTAWKNSADAFFGNYDNASGAISSATSALDAAAGNESAQLTNAQDKAGDAKDSIASAQEKVEDIQDKLKAVETQLQDEKNATEIGNAGGGITWDNLTGITECRTAMINVIDKYYLQQLLNQENAQLVALTNYYYVKNTSSEVPDIYDENGNLIAKTSYDSQEYNYYAVNYDYIDSEGNQKSGTKYFNWCFTQKTIKSNGELSLGRAVDNNTTQGIVVYEKTADEINANNHAVNYQKEHGSDIVSGSVQEGNAVTLNKQLSSKRNNKGYLSDYYKCFVYTDSQGKKQYLTYFELKDLTDAATDGAATVTTTQIRLEDGSVTELKEVVQNQNDLNHTGNCLIVGSENKILKYTMASQSNPDYTPTNGEPKTIGSNYGRDNLARLGEETISRIQTNSRALNTFLDTSTTAGITANDIQQLQEKYAKFNEVTENAVEAAASAMKEAQELENAINSLISNQAANSPSLNAKTVLDKSYTSDTNTATVGDQTITLSTAEGKAIPQDVVDRISEKSGIKTIAGESTLNDLTMAQLIYTLDGLKSTAQTKAQDALNYIQTLQGQLGLLQLRVAPTPEPEPEPATPTPEPEPEPENPTPTSGTTTPTVEPENPTPTGGSTTPTVEPENPTPTSGTTTPTVEPENPTPAGGATTPTTEPENPTPAGGATTPTVEPENPTPAGGTTTPTVEPENPTPAGGTTTPTVEPENPTPAGGTTTPTVKPENPTPTSGTTTPTVEPENPTQTGGTTTPTVEPENPTPAGGTTTPTTEPENPAPTVIPESPTPTTGTVAPAPTVTQDTTAPTTTTVTPTPTVVPTSTTPTPTAAAPTVTPTVTPTVVSTTTNEIVTPAPTVTQDTSTSTTAPAATIIQETPVPTAATITPATPVATFNTVTINPTVNTDSVTPDTTSDASTQNTAEGGNTTNEAAPIVTIEEENVAKADTIQGNVTTTIEEESVAKASGISAAGGLYADNSISLDKKHLDFRNPRNWWLLIVAAGGAAGKYFYGLFAKRRKENDDNTNQKN